jgi:hypothetical protein
VIFIRVCLISLVFVTLNPGCFLSPKTPSQNKTTALQDSAPAAFTPPSDSSLTPARLAAWFACNNGLDSLSIAFADPVTMEKKVSCDSARLIFRESQNRLCMRNGLKSGYVEYKWIMDNLGNSRNKPAYDSMLRKQ